jgi:hypothetical protein
MSMTEEAITVMPACPHWTVPFHIAAQIASVWRGSAPRAWRESSPTMACRQREISALYDQMKASPRRPSSVSTRTRRNQVSAAVTVAVTMGRASGRRTTREVIRSIFKWVQPE